MEEQPGTTEDLIRLVESASDSAGRRRAAMALLDREAIAEVSLRTDLCSRLRDRFLAEPDIGVATLLRRVDNRIHLRHRGIADPGAVDEPSLSENDVAVLREEIRRAAELHDRANAAADPFSARFDVLGIHRRGGMAVVLEALRVEDGQRVAIKRLLDELSDRRSLVERFRREAAVLERLHHPRIAPLLEWGSADDQLYFVLEWMPGGSMDECWPESSQQQRIRWLADAAEALAFAHAMGVVHRDVKPSNILIDADGRARLADFGLSRTWGEPSLTRPGAVLGTPPYIAPEQRAAPDDAGPPADVFALGMIARDFDFSCNAPADVATILAQATATDPVVRPSVVRVRDALLRWIGAPHALPRM